MNRSRRLKAVEVSLTPVQVVLLWMKDALKGTFENGGLQSPPPRSAIANSVARIVRNALKDQPEDVVERAVLQARQEADWLYNIVVDVNGSVQNQFIECNREVVFLLGYFAALMRGGTAKKVEEQLRVLTLFFAEKILILDEAVSRISAERFEGRPILFSNSVTKLESQIDLVVTALDYFNYIAKEANFSTLELAEICDRLRSEVDKRVSCWVLVARAAMLGFFGEEHDLRANFAQLVALESTPSFAKNESSVR